MCGFHAPGRFDEIVRSRTACSRPSAPTRARAGARRRPRHGLSAWDRRTQEGFLRNLVVREGRRTGQLQVRLVTSPGELPVES